MPNIKSCQKGQGLIEVVAAITIIAISLSAIISLIVISLTADRGSKNRIIAVNLAREAIEIARNKRDSNWLDIEAGTAGIEWDSGLYAASKDYSGIIEFDETENNDNFDDWDFQFQPDDIDDNPTDRCRIYLENGIYKQSKDAIGGIPTKYRRLILLNPICEMPNGSETIISAKGSDCGGGIKIGIQAIARVDWIESGQNHSLSLEDRLYNWK